MDPIFNEKCADAALAKAASNNPDSFGCAQHAYTLMHKDGVYQWRWLPPRPADATDSAVSPPFNTLKEAKAWGLKQRGGRELSISIDGWKPVNP